LFQYTARRAKSNPQPKILTFYFSFHRYRKWKIVGRLSADAAKYVFTIRTNKNFTNKTIIYKFRETFERNIGLNMDLKL
jgi:hypothetical protein